MVMTAIAILERVKESDTHVVLLSDRLTLEDQLLRAFSGSGIECRRANTGRELLDLLESSQIRVITSLIQKFDAAVRSQARQIDNPNIFVLVDEADRSQFGQFAETMRYVLPRACFVGFTDAPTLDALERFGPFITRPYSMEHAVRDGVLLPLYYEERKVAEKLPPDISDLEDDSFAETLQSLEYTRTTAADVSRHFGKHFADTPLKGVLIARSQSEALAYKNELEKLGQVTSEVFITAPRSNRQWALEPLQDLHAANVRKFGSAQRFEQDLLDRFNNTPHPQILICVDRFVGLDVPRCGVVYLMRRLKPSALVQAVSRGMRSWGNKTHGLAVDYFRQHQMLADALEVKTDDSDPLSRPTGSRRPLPRRFAALDQPTQLEIVLPSDLELPETVAREGFRQVITEGLQQAGQLVTADQLEAVSERVHTAVLSNRKVDWTLSPQARNRMLAAIEDELFQARDEEGRSLDVAVIDRLLHACLEVAILRLP
jgi:type I restriction enzyme R subunit